MADPGADLLCPLDFRYGRPEAKALFTREARFARWLQVEAALARALAEEKVIPTEAARAIAKAATPQTVSLRRVEELEKETRHDIMALTRALAEKSGDAGRYVHFGATSNDILDTALGLELSASAELLKGSLDGLVSALVEQSRRHRATPMVGRTHGQHAVPLSLGYKLATFAAEFSRHRVRLQELRPRLAVGKMSGAVGTGASFGPLAESIERRTLEPLGLTPDEAPTQVTGRDRLAEFANWLALVASSCDRWATEVRNLQRSEIAELSEPFDEAKQVGSSTMAQKRNPINCENVSSLARLVRALPGPALENMVQWHERDLANSANERFLYAHGVVLLDEMIHRLTDVTEDLRVDRERMSANLDLTGGGVMAEQLMLSLTERGLPRAEAHEVLRGLTRGLKAGGEATLMDRARRDATVRRFLTDGQVERLLTPKAYVEAAAAKTDRVLAGLGGAKAPRRR